MRRICTFVPALALTGTVALAPTVGVRTPGAAHRPAGAAPAPNQVIVWNRLLLTILGTPGAQRPAVHATSSLAMMHLAIADAVAAITGRFPPYRFSAPVSRYASQAAAAASAAYEVLMALYPTMKPALDAHLASTLATVRHGSGKTAGIAIGAQAGQAILRLGDDHVSSAPPSPFVLERADQFRPVSPPPVRGEEYVNALAEVRSLGARNSMTRSPDQTEIGRFWSAPIETYWNHIAQAASLAHSDSVADDARLFALLNTSLADGVLALSDAKQAYRFGRPAAAIHHDGVPSHTAWAPLVSTPDEPSYPAGHSVISFGAAWILGHEFGDRFDFTVSSAALPGVTRTFSSFSAAAQEAGLSRICAGAQFRFDHTAGQRLGLRMSEYVAQHAFHVEWTNGVRRSRRRVNGTS